jgi:hypothetical protein
LKHTANDSRIANFDKQYLFFYGRAPNLLINSKEEEEEEGEGERLEGKKNQRKRIYNVSYNSSEKKETRNKKR